METAVATAELAQAPQRSRADRVARRILGLEPDAPKASIIGAHGAFSRSIAISALRCTVTYLLLPLVAPLVDLSSTVGPFLGLTLGLVSMVAIAFAARRFFAADHRYRWWYAAIGGVIFVLLVVQGALDIATLAG